MIEGGRQEALLASQSPIPEADREDSEERPMEVIEATKAMTSEAANGDNGVVFGNGGVVVDGMGELGEDLNNGGDDFILKTPAPTAAMDIVEPPSVGQGWVTSRVNMIRIHLD